MKTKQSIAALVALTLTTAVTTAQEAPDPNAHGDPYVPVGTLAVNPTFVQTGVKPNLDWGIEYPSVFQDLAVVGGSGSIVTTQEVEVEIRVNGACFNCGTKNGKELPVAVWVRTGGSGAYWSLIFYGDAYDVNPSKVLFKNKVDPGTGIEIAARGQSESGSWYPVVWTIEDSVRLAHLTNGDSVPDSVLTDFASGDVESFTTALLTDDAMTVEVGPKDMIYLFELSSSEPEEPCFDLQDVVVSVQFSTKNNNGHGNNIDGVDVSNPGGSKEGEDSDPTILDEDGNWVPIDDEKKVKVN